MDLISATKQVKLDSKKQKNVLYYIILLDDEFEVRDYKTIGEKDDIYSIWRSGVKIDSPEGKEQPEETSSIKAEKSKTMKAKTEKTAKKAVPKKEKVETKKLGASFFFDKSQQKQLEGILKEKALSFNGWVNEVVAARLK